MTEQGISIQDNSQTITPAASVMKGKELHLCPLQIDIVDRVITQMSNEGDIVFDPFGGIMTVPVRAILLKRYGIGVELAKEYFLNGAMYCKAMEEKLNIPTLFDELKEAG